MALTQTMNGEMRNFMFQADACRRVQCGSLQDHPFSILRPATSRLNTADSPLDMAAQV